jgi:FkbM family methyltransferase
MGMRDATRAALPVFNQLGSVSFSQYGEDVVLRNFWPAQTGFYIDVGAYHPWQFSNTYKLYLRGWSGITIEPNPEVTSAFKRARPRDIHLNLGISRTASECIYYKFREPGLNTFDNKRASIVQSEIIETTFIKCITLKDVILQYCRRELDLLSVDCEGLDLDVISTIDFDDIRPTVIIVEDFDQFKFGSKNSSPIRTFLLEREYELASQAVYSFIYVDTTAFRRDRRASGFRLDLSPIGGLAR